MSRLSKLRIVDPVLTSIARGYVNAAYVAEALFPVVPMSKEAGKIPTFGKEAFKIYRTERGIRGRSNRVNPESFPPSDVVLAEHDLEYPIDYRERDEAADILSLETHATNVVTGGVGQGREMEAAALAQNPANYADTNKLALSGDSRFSVKDKSDPIGVIETAKDAVRARIAIRPNTMVMGPATFADLKQHPQLLARIQYAMKGIVTLDLMKEIFGVPNIVVGEAVYADDAGTLYDIWADNIVLAFVPEAPASGRSMYAPSYGYTFRKRTMPQVDKYDENGGKVDIVRNTDIYKCKIVGAEAGYLITNTR